MSDVLVSPMDETLRPLREAAPRLQELRGSTLALLDISKPGGRFFLDRLEKLLKERYGVAHILRESKPAYTKPAPEEFIRSLTGAAGVIEALAD